MLLGARLLVALLCCIAAPLAAQDSAPVSPAPAPVWGVWGGIARNSPGNLWGAETGRDAEMVAVRLTWPLARSSRAAIDYIVDVIPAARVSMVRDKNGPPPCAIAKPGEVCVKLPVMSDTRPVIGFGMAPLGLQVRHRMGARVQAYADFGGGVLRFAREMPMDGAARLNFTAQLGTGILVGRPGSLGVALGYKFYHISNAGTATYNPGLDNHMLVAGLQQILAF